MSTERQLSQTQVAKHRKGDPAIYLRTYDVINSLDRAERTLWWEKALGGVSRVRQLSPAPAKAGLIKAVAALQASAKAVVISAARESQLTLAPEKELTLVRAVPPQSIAEQAVAPATRPTELLPGEGRRVSWVLLAVVAMITAGLTFAVIHFAWASLTAREGLPPNKHISSYVSSRSALPPSLFSGSTTHFDV